MRKVIGSILFVLICSIVLSAQNSLDLTNVVTADILRIDEGQKLHAFITINLVNGLSYKTDLYLNDDDANLLKNGTAVERNAIRKKYIRQAIKNYLDSVIVSVTIIPQGTTSVSKSNISNVGDINP